MRLNILSFYSSIKNNVVLFNPFYDGVGKPILCSCYNIGLCVKTDLYVYDILNKIG